MRLMTLGSTLAALLLSATAPADTAATPDLSQGANFEHDRDRDRDSDRDRDRDSDRFVLRFDGESFRGLSTIRLKQEIRDQLGVRPGELRDAELESVMVLAKSRRGEGRVWLQVGNRETRMYRVDGGNFNSDNPSTYDRILIDNPSRRERSDGVWQLHFDGNIRVARIVVDVRDGRWRD
jgi:hypothetical protein